MLTLHRISLRMDVVALTTMALVLAFVTAGAEAQERGRAQANTGSGDISSDASVKTRIIAQTGAGSVEAIAISPDGHLVLSAAGKVLKVWEVATRKEVRSINCGDDISALALSPDGRYAVTSTVEGVKLWDIAQGTALRGYGTEDSGRKTALAFSPDGRFILASSRHDGTLVLWDVKSGRSLRKFHGHSDEAVSLGFSANGQLAISASDDKTAKIWNVSTGKKLHSLDAHAGRLRSAALSPDGRFAVTIHRDGPMILWDAASGSKIRTFGAADNGEEEQEFYQAVFSPDGRQIVATTIDQLKVLDAETGKELRASNETSIIDVLAVTSDGKYAVSGGVAAEGMNETLKFWDVATARELFRFSGHAEEVSVVAYSPDGRLAVSGGTDKTLKLWEMASGREIANFAGHTNAITSAVFSSDGRYILSGSLDNTLKLWDIETGELAGSYGEAKKPEGDIPLMLPPETVTAAAISKDGRLALAGGCNRTLPNVCEKGWIKLWDLTTGKELRRLDVRDDGITSVAFSPDDRFAVSMGCKRNLIACSGSRVRTWDLATGKPTGSFSGQPKSEFDLPILSDGRNFLPGSVAYSPDGRFILSGSYGDLTLWNTTTRAKVRRFKVADEDFKFAGEYIHSVAFSHDGRLAVSGSQDGTVVIWDVSTGRKLHQLKHDGPAISAIFSPDGRFVLSGSHDGTVRAWDVASGRELARMLATGGGEWITVTTDGFFAAPNRDTDLLAVARSINATTIGQVHQSLFNPDLVREALAGDPNNEVAQAAKVVNLDKVLDSGPAPGVEIVSPPSSSERDLITLTARIEDRGKGIGRIEWRVNGVTAAVSNAPAGAGSQYVVEQELALDPGENAIEVIAYNADNLLASLPGRAVISFPPPARSVKPKLHVLAIGINAYEDRGGVLPETDTTALFPPLGLAVGDAKAFAWEIRKAGKGLYSEVRIRTALDREATASGLDRIVREIAASISPRDTFVFFAAGHGYSHNGRFYLIPQDYQGGPNPEALANRAIGQEQLQKWFAGIIKAKKTLILLDTCESGALTGGYSRSRVDRPASEAAIGRLHEATGRPVLTAAAEGQGASETAKLGHGVFTYALLQALHRGDSNNDKLIQVSELAAYVEDLVPKLVANGEVRAAIARGTSEAGQSARFGTTGSDFTLVNRLR